MEVKTIQNITKSLKWSRKHLHSENYGEFNYNIKVFADYGLSTVHLKKNQNLALTEKYLK